MHLSQDCGIYSFLKFNLGKTEEIVAGLILTFKTCKSSVLGFMFHAAIALKISTKIFIYFVFPII